MAMNLLLVAFVSSSCLILTILLIKVIKIEDRFPLNRFVPVSFIVKSRYAYIITPSTLYTYEMNQKGYMKQIHMIHTVKGNDYVSIKEFDSHVWVLTSQNRILKFTANNNGILEQVGSCFRMA
jgi:hypothetical protein